MRPISLYFLLLLMCSGLLSCENGTQQASKVKFSMMSVNDVYEITPLENGKAGGMARVAAVRKKLLAEGNPVLTILAGDFLNPSGMGQTVVDGSKLYGKQMVDVMNQVGIDLVTFGNHELDLKEAPLLERISESDFQWISANVMHKTDSSEAPFQWKGKDIPPYKVYTFQNEAGDSVRMGVISVTLPENTPSYTKFYDYKEKAREAFDAVSPKSDFVIAVTHLEMEEDEELAKAVPGLRLIIGGHEHVYQHAKIGETEICKADANAKSAWVYQMEWDPAKQALSIDADTMQLRQNISPDPEIENLVNDWKQKVFVSLANDGFDPDSVVATVEEPLDGLESHNRDHVTNLGQLICASMMAAWPGTELAMTNSGSIRIDDMVEGDVTQYDIIRILPFGGASLKVQMPGSMLVEMLEIGSADELKGNGGFLQYAGITKGADGWEANGKAIDPNKTYSVAGGDYLMQFEKPYQDLYKKYEGKYSLKFGTETVQTDVRKGLIDYMSKQ